MTTYAVFGLLLILAAIEIRTFLRVDWKNWRILLALTAVMLLLMLIFDTYLTALPIVEYNKNLVLGVYIGSIPLEDISYLLVVVILVPSLFEYFNKDEESKK